MRFSIAIPVYKKMQNGEYFLNRLLESLAKQTFRDFEVVMTHEGNMAQNSNNAIKKCKGELIKVLYQDDYLAHPESLQKISDAFEGEWLVTGCTHDPGGEYHFPSYNDRIHEGLNTIGSPSVLTLKNDNPLLFDETMNWLLDCDLYRRLHDKFGEPTILNDINVVIGKGEHQTTSWLSDEIKEKEFNYLKQKYDTGVAANV